MTTRMTLATPALDSLLGESLNDFYRNKETYSEPVAKTAEIPNFRFEDSCRRQIHLMGTTRIERSERQFMRAELSNTAGTFTHFPGIQGFQILRLGTH